MATIYIPPPTPEEMLHKYASWIARLFGIKVTVTIDHDNGDTSTCVCDSRQRAARG